MNHTQEVLFEELAGEGGNIGLISLNRPQVLNALNLSMTHAIYHQLKIWAADQAIKAVVIRAQEGRAFCAGGDLRLVYGQDQAHKKMIAQFFQDEYALNQFIFNFPKPYIAFMDGITMGGGAGLSIHGSHRISTERLVFAMPETGIGFFPDIGGTYFLPRLQGNIGFYLGLTGAKITADDCVAIGLAHYKVASEQLSALLAILRRHAFNPHDPKQSVTDLIQQFALSVAPSLLIEEQPLLAACFSLDSLESIMQALHSSQHLLCKKAHAELIKKSPTSLKVSLRALQEGRHLDFAACMQREYQLACHFLQSHDFLEGIRALIIDKDQQPQWQPATLAEVSLDAVAAYFDPLPIEFSSI